MEIILDSLYGAISSTVYFYVELNDCLQDFNGAYFLKLSIELPQPPDYSFSQEVVRKQFYRRLCPRRAHNIHDTFIRLAVKVGNESMFSVLCGLRFRRPQYGELKKGTATTSRGGHSPCWFCCALSRRALECRCKQWISALTGGRSASRSACGLRQGLTTARGHQYLGSNVGRVLLIEGMAANTKSTEMVKLLSRAVDPISGLSSIKLQTAVCLV
jgi:hypothetical protein